MSISRKMIVRCRRKLEVHFLVGRNILHDEANAIYGGGFGCVLEKYK